jgi:hypothetical protein
MAKGKKKLIEKFIKGDTFVLRNVKVKWAWLDPDRPDTKYEHCWRVDIILDDETEAILKSSGFNVKVDKDGDTIYRAKKKCKTRAGKSQRAPEVFSLDGRTRFTEIIGNGSTCNVEIFGKYHEVAGETHLSGYLNKIQVVDHIPYGGSTPFDDLTAGDPAPADDTPF